jgi:adenosylcobinamide kinase/adenosylcobinamide-phosphate guanylyltransferase
MGKITLVLGGARSGKSRFAIRLARKAGRKAAFIATCQGLDAEMARRISSHRKARPPGWRTVEEPLEISSAVRRLGNAYDVVLIDCLTLWVSNMLMKRSREKVIETGATKLIGALGRIRGDAILVSNEVGLGIVPANALARDFRDIGGRINQIVARSADEVYFMIAGIPVKIKGE